MSLGTKKILLEIKFRLNFHIFYFKFFKKNCNCTKRINIHYSSILKFFINDTQYSKKNLNKTPPIQNN